MISVLMSVFNGGKYLNESISSILNQTYSNFELIIINDGSTDDSEDIIMTFNDPRIMYFKNHQNRGLIYSLNTGILEAKGIYIVRMDADDFSHRDRLRILHSFMEIHLDISILGSQIVENQADFPLLDESTITLKDYKSLNTFAIFNCPLLHPTVIFRSDFLKQNDLKYDQSYIHAEDNALWLDSMRLGKISMIDFPLLKYRKHINQVSNKFHDIQQINSTKKRIDFFFHRNELNDHDKKIYRNLSYKTYNLFISDFSGIGQFVNKLRNRVLEQNQIEVDMDLFEEILRKRLSILYLRNTHLGLTLFYNYLLNFNLLLGLRFLLKLFIKTLLKFKYAQI